MESEIMAWFSNYAYNPVLVYSAVIAIMFASSFGLPIPEEVTLLSVGVLAYIGLNPDTYPPPSPDAWTINVHVAAFVCFAAVLVSDYVVFKLGKHSGDKIMNARFTKRLVKPETLAKVTGWTQRHGHWAAGVFRFTPALRFPGHLACGMMKVPSWKFLAIDGTAALVSVPTQVYLVAYYGEEILARIKEFKIVFFSIIAAAIIIVLMRKLFLQRKPPQTA